MIASGDVVAAGVAENVVEGAGAADVFRGLADDDGELALVVDLVAVQVLGDEDRFAGVLEGVDALHEEDGAFGDLGVGLGGVLSVVESDAEDLGGCYGREELGDPGVLGGDAMGAVDVALYAERGAVGLFCGVVRSAGGIEIADDLHRISVSGLFACAQAAIDQGPDMEYPAREFRFACNAVPKVLDINA